MTPIDKPSWIAWHEQKATFIRGQGEFPSAPQITDEQVDDRLRDWTKRHEPRCKKHGKRNAE